MGLFGPKQPERPYLRLCKTCSGKGQLSYFDQYQRKTYGPCKGCSNQHGPYALGVSLKCRCQGPAVGYSFVFGPDVKQFKKWQKEAELRELHAFQQSLGTGGTAVLFLCDTCNAQYLAQDGAGERRKISTTEELNDTDKEYNRHIANTLVANGIYKEIDVDTGHATTLRPSPAAAHAPVSVAMSSNPVSVVAEVPVVVPTEVYAQPEASTTGVVEAEAEAEARAAAAAAAAAAASVAAEAAAAEAAAAEAAAAEAAAAEAAAAEAAAAEAERAITAATAAAAEAAARTAAEAAAVAAAPAPVVVTAVPMPPVPAIQTTPPETLSPMPPPMRPSPFAETRYRIGTNRASMEEEGAVVPAPPPVRRSHSSTPRAAAAAALAAFENQHSRPSSPRTAALALQDSQPSLGSPLHSALSRAKMRTNSLFSLTEEEVAALQKVAIDDESLPASPSRQKDLSTGTSLSADSGRPAPPQVKPSPLRPQETANTAVTPVDML